MRWESAACSIACPGARYPPFRRGSEPLDGPGRSSPSPGRWCATPGLLILDEATSSIDPATERKIQESLERLLHGRTSVIVAHRLSTITSADRILVMQRGRLIEEGTHVQLLARGGVYAALFDLQFRVGEPV